MANILIACGHDNYGNGGCVNPKYGTEQQYTREFSKTLTKSLREKGHTVTVFNVYHTSRSLYTCLSRNMIDKNNLKKYDYIIELHFNAGVNDKKGNGRITGTEILITKENGDEDMIRRILSSLNHIGLKSRGIKYRTDLYNMNICKRLGVKYMLWEVCFMDDEDDMQFYIMYKDLIAVTFSEYFKI